MRLELVEILSSVECSVDRAYHENQNQRLPHYVNIGYKMKQNRSLIDTEVGSVPVRGRSGRDREGRSLTLSLNR